MKMKLFFCGIFLGVSIYINAQTVYIPNGSSGIGTSSNGNVGIGTTTPSSQLDVNGNIQISKASLPMGLMTEVGGYTPIVNLSLNFREPNANASYLGASFRIDSRPTAPLFSWLRRTAGSAIGNSNTEPTLMVLTSNGYLGIGNNLWNPTQMLEVQGNVKANQFIGDGSKLTGISASSKWTTIGSNIYYNSGNVGIGNQNPYYKLDVIGSFRVSGNSELFGGANKIYGNSDPTNYYLGHYPVSGSDGLDIHWYGGIRLGDGTGNVLQVTNGNVGIGTLTPQNKLDVNGTIRAKEVKVETGWADFVFTPTYKLRPLSEVEQFIKTNGHLPEIPKAEEVKQNGVNLGEMQTKLLQKVEELTLYVIELKKENEQLKKEKQQQSIKSEAKYQYLLQLIKETKNK